MGVVCGIRRKCTRPVVRVLYPDLSAEAAQQARRGSGASAGAVPRTTGKEQTITDTWRRKDADETHMGHASQHVDSWCRLLQYRREKKNVQ